MSKDQLAVFEEKLENALSNLSKKSDEAIERTEKGEAVSKELKTAIENLKGEVQRAVDNVRNLEEKGGLNRSQAHEKSLINLIGENPEYKSLQKAGGALSSGQTFGMEFKGDDYKTALERKAAVVTRESSGLLVPEVDRTLNILPRNDFILRTLIPSIPVSSPAFSYFQEVALTLNAGMVAEGTAKPQTDFSFERKDETVKKIAVWTHITEETAADLPQLMGYINELLTYDILYKEEEQILRGDGTGNNLNGLLTNATEYSAARMRGKPATDTAIDVIRRMIAQVRVDSKRSADFVSMSEMDWLDIELQKDENGRYIFANIQGLTTPLLWGRPVAVSDALDDTTGEVLVGHSRGAMIYDREQLRIEVGRINDDFIKNQFVVLAEKRLGLGVRMPRAFVKAQLNPDGEG